MDLGGCLCEASKMAMQQEAVMANLPTKSFCGIYITKLSLIIGLMFGVFYWFGETLVHRYVFKDGNFLHSLILMDYNELWMRSLLTVVIFASYCYITSERIYKRRIHGIIAQQRSRMLCGMLPICSYCKKIRASDNSWHRLENFINERTGVNFTHGICPDCLKKLHEWDYTIRGEG